MLSILSHSPCKAGVEENVLGSDAGVVTCSRMSEDAGLESGSDTPFRARSAASALESLVASGACGEGSLGVNFGGVGRKTVETVTFWRTSNTGEGADRPAGLPSSRPGSSSNRPFGGSSLMSDQALSAPRSLSTDISRLSLSGSMDMLVILLSVSSAGCMCSVAGLGEPGKVVLSGSVDILPLSPLVCSTGPVRLVARPGRLGEGVATLVPVWKVSNDGMANGQE